MQKNVEIAKLNLPDAMTKDFRTLPNNKWLMFLFLGYNECYVKC